MTLLNEWSIRRVSRDLLTLALAACTTMAWAQSEPSVTVRPASDEGSGPLLIIDNQIVEAGSIQIQRGQQAMIWIRELEKLGWGTVESPQPDRISLRGKNVTLTFIKGEGVAMVNSLSVRLPIDTYLRDGQFMVPLSFVAKALGYHYELAFKPVVTIISAPPKAGSTNQIRGRVTHNGAGVQGVTVRAVDKSFTVVRGASAKTDLQGAYSIGDLPDGEYMAYVYTGDNPSFFNRASEPVQVRSGRTYDAKPIALGRIITPVTPKPGTQAAALGNDSLLVSWKAIDGAAGYSLIIRDRDTEKQVYKCESQKPECRVPVKSLRTGKSYEVQVTALSGSGEFLGGTAGEGGTPWTFTLADSPS